jgi:hypothetical protein
MAALQKDQYKFMVISRSLLLGMRNVADKICRGNKKTNFLFSSVVKCCRFEQATYDNVTHRMRFACVTKATNEQPECVKNYWGFQGKNGDISVLIVTFYLYRLFLSVIYIKFITEILYLRETQHFPHSCVGCFSNLH